jgi:hypothetical protein
VVKGGGMAMKLRLIALLTVMIIIGIAISASASGYIATGLSYRAFSSDMLWTPPNWQQNLKGSLFLGLEAVPSIRLNSAVYIGYGGLAPELVVIPADPLITISARAGMDYDLLKYEKDGLYFGLGPTAGISYGNVSYGSTTGKLDFNAGVQAILSMMSGKLQLEGSASYTFRDVFVNGSFIARYNPVGSFIVFCGIDYLRRDGFVTAGVGMKF